MKRVAVIVAIALVVAALAALAFEGPEPAATVAGEPITVSELRTRVAPLTQTTSYKEEIGQGRDPQGARHQLEQRVLTELIREAILGRAADELNVSVTSHQVDAYIESIKRDREIKSDQELRKRIDALGLTMAEWRKTVRFTVLERALQRRIVERARPTEDEARAYYRSHLDRYSTAHVEHIVVRDRALAERLLARLRSAAARDLGALFARMARRYSIDPSTKDKGGDLGFVERGSFSIVLPQLDRVINDMKAGDLAGPVKTRLGFHVVRLVSRRPTPFEKVRSEIEAKLLSPSDPYRSFLEDAYSEVSIAPRYGHLDPSFRVVDRPKESGSD